MANPNITGLHLLRQSDAFCCVSSAAGMAVVSHSCVKLRFVPLSGVAQGRIVSISRGSPPPKPR